MGEAPHGEQLQGVVQFLMTRSKLFFSPEKALEKWCLLLRLGQHANFVKCPMPEDISTPGQLSEAFQSLTPEESPKRAAELN